MNKELVKLTQETKISRSLQDWRRMLNAMRLLIESENLEGIHAYWWEMEQIVSIATFRERSITDGEGEELANYLEKIEKEVL